jgi:hypothetical protein
MQQFLETGERKPGQGLVPVEHTRSRLGAIIIGAYLASLLLVAATAIWAISNGMDARLVIDAFNPLTGSLAGLAGVVVGFYFARSVK